MIKQKQKYQNESFDLPPGIATWREGGGSERGAEGSVSVGRPHKHSLVLVKNRTGTCLNKKWCLHANCKGNITQILFLTKKKYPKTTRGLPEKNPRITRSHPVHN